jgi:hypothetical protein
MASLLDLTRLPHGDHTPVVRLATAFLDDYVVRVLHADADGGYTSLCEAITILVEESHAGVDLSRPLAAMRDGMNRSELVAGTVYVLPMPALHIDPWTRITVWGVCFGVRPSRDPENQKREIERLASRILRPAGGLDCLELYVTLWTVEQAVIGATIGHAIDALTGSIPRIPHVAQSSPWWVASVVHAARRRNCLGPLTASMMPPPDDDSEVM